MRRVLALLAWALLAWVPVVWALLAACPRRGEVDWAQVAHSLYLVAEDYQESAEQPGRLDQRRPALRRLLQQTAEEIDKRDRALSSEIAALRERLEKPIDYQFWQEAESLSRSVEAKRSFSRAPAAKPDLARGAQVYAKACAACHGDARPEIRASMDPPPPRLERSEKSWRPYDMFARITYGGLETAMPGFGEALTVQERWDVAFYLFAARWPPCRREAAPLRASELAVSSDFDLSNKVPYDAIACLRRNFLPP